MGPKNPKKRRARDRDPRTLEQTDRDRDPRNREKEHGQQQADRNKWNAQTRTAQSSSNLSSQWWTRCTASRRSCARRRDGRDPSGDTELEQVTCESGAKLDKNHEHSSGMQESIEAEGTEEHVLALHTEMCEKSGVTSVEEGHDVESDVAEETMSAVVKLAKEIDEPDIGQPSAECQFRWPSRRRLVTR